MLFDSLEYWFFLPLVLLADALLRVHLDLWLFDGDLGAFLRGLER